MVASDRVSVFDVVLPDEIPDKGRVLTALSTFWFDQTADLVPEPRDLVRPHRLPRDRRPESRAGRCSCARPGRSGSSASCAATCSARRGASTRRRARSAASPLPAGLRQAERLPEPLFTPTTKAETGHDLPLTDAEAVALVGADVYEQLRDLSLRLYEFGAAHAGERGLILADTKFEFGELDGELLVIDEMMTPDSSRYWPRRRRTASARRRRRSTSSTCATTWTRTGWDHEPPAPHMPAEVIDEHARARTSRPTS